VDRDAYVVRVLEQLYRALNRRDVFASPSNRWADPRARLLDGKQRGAVPEDVLHGLSLEERVVEHLWVRALDAAWQLMAERLEETEQDAKSGSEIQPNGRPKLNVDRLGAVGESASLGVGSSVRALNPAPAASPRALSPSGQCGSSDGMPVSGSMRRPSLSG
jgi:hypothetical protein